jgi:molybdopterin synthase sulfur carrier subunit
MSIRVLYFASLKEAMGKAEEVVELPTGIATAGALRDWLIADGRAALASAKNLRMAVNQDMARPDDAVKAGDEIAFFPPVTGG